MTEPTPLDSLQELESKATPGKWQHQMFHGTFEMTSPQYLDGREVHPLNVLKSCEEDWHPTRADADLIVALRNNASWLIERARRAEELEGRSAELEDKATAFDQVTATNEDHYNAGYLDGVKERDEAYTEGAILHAREREKFVRFEVENEKLMTALRTLLPAQPFQEDYDSTRGEYMGSYCRFCRGYAPKHKSDCSYEHAARLLKGEKE